MKPVSIICWCPETYARSSDRISFDSDLFVTYARRRSTPVSTVLWKLVRFFIINIFLIKRPSKLKSCKLFSTIQERINLESILQEPQIVRWLKAQIYTERTKAPNFAWLQLRACQSILGSVPTATSSGFAATAR